MKMMKQPASKKMILRKICLRNHVKVKSYSAGPWVLGVKFTQSAHVNSIAYSPDSTINIKAAHSKPPIHRAGHDKTVQAQAKILYIQTSGPAGAYHYQEEPMNIERIIQMIFRMVLRRGISFGIKKSVNLMSGDRKDENKTPQERQEAQANKKAAKRARQAMKISRRIGRF